MTQFQHLDKSLSSNGSLLALIYANHNQTYLNLLDHLFCDLHQSKCNGVDIKVKEVFDLLRFQALVSELEFARYFALTKNWQVDLLPNNYFGNRRAPDMVVISSKRKYFVEVKNIQFDAEEHNFGTKIAALLNEKGLHFMVYIESSSMLATPAYKHQTRRAKEKLVEASLKEFGRKISKKSITKEFTISTSIADVRLFPMGKDKSFLGFTSTGVISEPEEYGQRIAYDIVNKSGKRDDWKDSELDIPYLIAIDDQTMMFDTLRYNVELFGKSTTYYPYLMKPGKNTANILSPLPVPNPTIDAPIQNALDFGWKDYLPKMFILRNDRTLIEDKNRGKLFTEPKLKNATAVLVKHHNNFFLFANPFADNRINKPDILAELSDCSIGW